MGQHGYTVLITVFLPLLLIIWASCLIICLYKHIVNRWLLITFTISLYFNNFIPTTDWRRIGQDNVRQWELLWRTTTSLPPVLNILTNTNSLRLDPWSPPSTPLWPRTWPAPSPWRTFSRWRLISTSMTLWDQNTTQRCLYPLFQNHHLQMRCFHLRLLP